MSRAFRILAYASLVLNAFVVGILVAHTYDIWRESPHEQAGERGGAPNPEGRGDRGGREGRQPPAFRDLELSPSQVQALSRLMEQRMDLRRDLTERLSPLRQDLFEALAAEPLDIQTVRQAYERLQAAVEEAEGHNLSALADFLGTLDAEQRSTLLNRLSQDRRLLPF